jgi:PAS domain S-box-containing protein
MALSFSAGSGSVILQEPQATQDIVQRLRETEDRFKVMADSSPVMLWMSAVDSNCYFFNKPWLDFTGRTLEQEVGAGWCEGIYFEDFQHCLDTYLDHFNARKPFRMRYRLRRHDGQYRWLLDTGVPRYSPDGTFMGFVGSCIDIQEMVEASEALANLNATLERRVQERTAQLADVNRELENFAYSVSHDLRAPLRQIGSYAELIRSELPPELVSGTLERYLGYLQEGADRAQELVRDGARIQPGVGRRAPHAARRASRRSSRISRTFRATRASRRCAGRSRRCRR